MGLVTCVSSENNCVSSNISLKSDHIRNKIILKLMIFTAAKRYRHDKENSDVLTAIAIIFTENTSIHSYQHSFTVKTLTQERSSLKNLWSEVVYFDFK